MYRTFLTILFAFMLVFSLSACGDDGNSDVIKIGFAGPLSGGSSAFGIQARDGAQLFIDHINEDGGINGKKLELVVRDDEGKADTASFVARELIGDKAVVAMAGNLNSRCTLATAAMANKGKGMAQITYGSTNPTICKGNPFTFRNIYTDDDAGRQLADFCKNVLKAKRVSCYYENDAYGKGLFTFFEERIKEIGLEMVYSKSYDVNMNPDYRSALQSFMGQNPEVLFISAAGDSTSTVCKIAKELNPNIQIISGDGAFQQDFIDGALDSSEGAIVAGPADFSGMETPEVKRFMTDFKTKFNEEPSVWAFQAYDSIGLLVHAIKKAGTDREKVAEYMRGMTTEAKGYTGVTGMTYFNEHGDPVGKPMNFFQVRNKKFEPYK